MGKIKSKANNKLAKLVKFAETVKEADPSTLVARFEETPVLPGWTTNPRWLRIAFVLKQVAQDRNSAKSIRLTFAPRLHIARFTCRLHLRGQSTRAGGGPPAPLPATLRPLRRLDQLFSRVARGAGPERRGSLVNSSPQLLFAPRALRVLRAEAEPERLVDLTPSCWMRVLIRSAKGDLTLTNLLHH